ncbi:pmpB [Symbiodinium sp. CCMP2592]|nr:pmpB [Symbiodinium sp. CCMP2592]
MRRMRIVVSPLQCWPGLRNCTLSSRSQRPARCDVADRNLSTSAAVHDDKPPSPICNGDLARMVEEARSPLKRGRRATEVAIGSHDYRYGSTLRGWSKNVAASAQRRDREKGWQSNIDANYLLDLVLEQGGLCAYSGIPMELLLPHSHWRVSIERINNRKGYIKGNCCLIAAEFNTAVHKMRDEAGAPTGSAQWSKQKVEELVHVRTGQVQAQRLQEGIAIARIRPSPTGPLSYRTFRGPDEEGRCFCSRCGIWKWQSEYSKCAASRTGMQPLCKQCACDAKLTWLQTLRGHGISLLTTARRRATSRKGVWTGAFALDLDDILVMLWMQGGRCYYSGVPLHCAAGPADWAWSIERLDNSVTYTKENCVLIAREFQTSDHSRKNAAYPVFGTAQWSRSKVNHVWGLYHEDCEARVVQGFPGPN